MKENLQKSTLLVLFMLHEPVGKGPWTPEAPGQLHLEFSFPFGPHTARGNGMGGEEVVWETSASFLCYFYLLFSPASTSPSSTFPSLFLLFFFSSYHNVSCSSWTPDWAVCPRSLCCCSSLPCSFGPIHSLLYQNSVSLPFPSSRPPAPLLPLPLLPNGPNPTICCVLPGWAPSHSHLRLPIIQGDHDRFPELLC